MKRKIVVELLENHKNVNFYTIRFVDEDLSEFEKFYDTFNAQEAFNEDLDKIVYWLIKLVNKVLWKDILGRKEVS